jgi:hypothetical protein
MGLMAPTTAVKASFRLWDETLSSPAISASWLNAIGLDCQLKGVHAG